jgi:hypothetical protein
MDQPMAAFDFVTARSVGMKALDHRPLTISGEQAVFMLLVFVVSASGVGGPKAWSIIGRAVYIRASFQTWRFVVWKP